MNRHTQFPVLYRDATPIISSRILRCNLFQQPYNPAIAGAAMYDCNRTGCYQYFPELTTITLVMFVIFSREGTHAALTQVSRQPGYSLR